MALRHVRAKMTEEGILIGRFRKGELKLRMNNHERFIQWADEANNDREGERTPNIFTYFPSRRLLDHFAWERLYRASLAHTRYLRDRKNKYL